MAEEVISACEAFYNGNDEDVRKQADRWLTEFQQNVESWVVCDTLLQSGPNNVPEHTLIWSAQTIRKKLLYGYHELPDQNSRESLRTSLMELMAMYVDGPKVVLTALCTGLATLAVQMEEWTEVVATAYARFATDQKLGWNCLLEFLTVLPEEVSNSRIPVTRPRRETVREACGETSGDVVNLLYDFMEQTGSNTEMQKRVVRAYTSWLRFHRVPPEIHLSSPMIDVVFQAMQAPDLFDMCVDAVVALLHATSNFSIHFDVVQKVVPLVAGLRELYEGAMNEGDEDTSHGVARVFVVMGERYMPLLTGDDTAGSEVAGMVIEYMLIVCEHPKHRTASMTFGFWTEFAHQLLRDKFKHMIPMYQPAFVSLTDVLAAQTQYPADDNALTKEEEDLWKRYRHDVGDTLKDVCFINNGATVIAQLMRNLNAALAGDTWQPVEAMLFCMRAIGRCVPKGEHKALPELMDVIPRLPTHEKLTYTCLLTIGAYSDWINLNPNYLQVAIEYVLDGVTNAELQKAATLALRNLCDACAEHLANEESVASLLDVFDQSYGHLSQKSSEEMVKGLGHVASALDGTPAAQTLLRVAGPIFEDVSARVDAVNNGQATATDTAADVENLLNLVSNLVRVANSNRHLKASYKHPIIELLEQTWDILVAVLRTYVACEGPMFALCDGILKYAIRSTQAKFEPVVEEVVGKMLACFKEVPFSCFVYVPNVLAGIFGFDDHMENLMRETMLSFSQAVFEILDSLDGFTAHPDVVSEYFEYVIRFLRRRPRYVILPDTPAFLEAQVRCAMFGIAVQHEHAAKATLAYFEHIVPLAANMVKTDAEPLDDRHVEYMQAVVIAIGADLVDGLIAVAASGSFFLPDISCVMWAFLSVCREEFKGWLGSSLAAMPETLLTNADKQHIMAGVLDAMDTANLTSVLDEMHRLVRSRTFSSLSAQGV